MRFSDTEINKLIKYLEKREISPGDAVDIIHASTPFPSEGQVGNRKFNWKMLRFTMYLWKRVEEEKKLSNLNSKTQTAFDTVSQKKYQDLMEGQFNLQEKQFQKLSKVNYSAKIDKEAKNLFKLVTDPRQKHFFKSRYYVYEGTHKTIPQDHIDHLMQWPKNTENSTDKVRK